jgi:aliphatic nitrilase
LICGENSNPLAITALAAERPSVHVASWPSSVSKDEGGMDQLIRGASQSLAYQLGAFVLSSHAVVSKAIAKELGQSDEDRAFLTRQVGRGSSMIVGPDRSILAAAPDEAWEGIINADVDLDACVLARHIHDFVGHYNRPDIFSLEVDRRAGPLVRMIDDADPAAGEMHTWSPAAADPQDGPNSAATVRIHPVREGEPG